MIFSEISEILLRPSLTDVAPVSGVSHLPDGEEITSFTVASVQDVETESNEVLSVKLIGCRGGGRISDEGAMARLTGEFIAGFQLLKCY